MIQILDTHTRALLRAVTVAGAVLALSACGQKTETPAPTEPAPTTTPAAVAEQSPDPHAAIVAEPANAPATVPGTGPAEGGTAIGGVVAGQDANKPRDKGPSEPTGGDGATTEPAATPAK